MKQLLWMALAALPMQAMANDEDPVAYKCYYCTPAEMEDAALRLGVGRQYIYDYSDRTIAGFEVAQVGGNLIAAPFPVEDWLERQYQGFMALLDPPTGSMYALFQDVELLAPGTDHGRTTQLLWGHHLSALHPEHGVARETVHRYLTSAPELSFLDTTLSQGRLLKFESELDKPLQLYAALQFGRGITWGGSTFQFDRASRRWNHVSSSANSTIQQSREDFAPTEGTHRYWFSQNVDEMGNAFIERAKWASVPVHGELPTSGNVEFVCVRSGEDIQCTID